MSSIQRGVKRIHPARPEPLEDRFWPIAVAVLATVGLAGGAITALMRGPWMWGSLLTMPLFIAAALITLHRLKSRWMKRSIQLAILTSLAIHLLVIIISATLDIFGGSIPRPVVERAPNRPSPTMVVSQREPQPIWEQINERETPDPVVESQREPTVRETNRQPQPVEVSQTQPTHEQRSLQRRESAPSVTRQGESMAQLHRSEARTNPQASPSPNTSQSETTANANQPATTEMPTPRSNESNSRAVASDNRSENARGSASESQPTTRPEMTSIAQRRESQIQPPTPHEMQSTARMRSDQLALPQASTASEQVAQSTVETAPSQSAPQPRESSAERARSQPAELVRDHLQPLPEAQLSPDTSTPRERTISQREPVPPTWSETNATATEPNRRATPSQTLASTEARESPANPSTSNSAVPQPQAAATSTTRGERGGANASTFQNLQSTQLASSGLAPAPSDATSQRRAENRVDPQPTLTSVERPNTSGRQTGEQQPQSAWQANVSQPSPLSSREQTSLQTSESAAAQTDATSRRTGMERPSEAGSELVDLGPVKLVADQAAERKSGGGSVDPGQLNTELPQLAARSAGGGQPTLDAASGTVTQTPTTSASAPVNSSESQLEARDTSQRLVGGSLPNSGAPAARSEESGEVIPEIANTVGSRSATSRRSADRSVPEGSMLSNTSDPEPFGSREANRVSRGPQVDATSQYSNPAAGQAAASGGADAGGQTRIQARGESGERASAPMALDIVAEPGLAGLSNDPRPGLGTQARPATRDVTEINLDQDARFRRRDAGGSPAVSPDANVANESFRSRRDNKSSAGPSTEAAIELGLEFLIRHQRSDGSWSLGDFDQDDPRHGQLKSSDVAATGLALLAFQGAGYTHRDFKYAEQVSRAVHWMLENQQANGLLFIEHDPVQSEHCRMYSHAIATLALSEAYGMTQDPILREPIERALNYMADTQDPKLGGWRYYEPGRMPGENTDTSVTGWMMMALQSARLADVHPRQRVWEGIDSWLGVARDADNEWQFRYNPFANEEVNRHTRMVTPSMTAVGLLMRLYTGWDRQDARLVAGGDYLLQHLPSDRTIQDRDTYYWYYATQVIRHLGGDAWTTWNARLHPLLVNSQLKVGPLAGSWDPYAPIPDRWASAGGRLYVTTMNLLSLEVNYRLLPLYDRSTR